VIIRQMNIYDFDEMLKLWEKVADIADILLDSKAKLERFLRKNSSYNLVCQAKNQIIGTILCGSDGQRAYIYHIAVRKDYESKSIATDLISEVIRKLRADGIEECRLFVIDDNYQEQDFWSNEGWKESRDLLVFSRQLNL